MPKVQSCVSASTHYLIRTAFTKDLLIDPSTRNTDDVRHVVAAAASSNSESRAAAFLREVGAPETAKAYGSYKELVTDSNVDIIYIATPHSHHYQHVRLALEAGKHVLIEKPITVNASQAQILYSIAKEKGLFLMEAVWTRFFPLTLAIQDFIRSGKLGTIKRVYADLSFWKDVEQEFGTEHRMVNMDLAGGALLDLGIYSLTWVFLVLYHLQDGETTNKTKKKPVVKGAISKYAQTGCDEMTAILLDFPGVHVGAAPDAVTDASRVTDNGDAHAFALTNMRVSHESNAAHPAEPVRIQGTLGDITISQACYRPLSYTLVPAQNESRGKLADFELKNVEHETPGGGHGMFWEADECARCVRDGKTESAVMGWDESVEVMRVMDEVRRQGGLGYPDKIESTEYPLEGFGL